jgi:integrase/recombinase XerD
LWDGEFCMRNRYEAILYSADIRNMLDSTLLNSNEKESVNILKFELKDKIYSSKIEDFYKFHKNNYTTSDLAEIFDISTRQVQNIFKDLGINRPRSSRVSKELQDINKDTPLANSTESAEGKYNYIAYESYEDAPECLREFLNYLSVIRGKSSNTVDGYKIDLSLFLRFLKMYKGLYPRDINFNDIIITDINDDFIRNIKLPDLYAFLSYAENNRDNSSYARARKVAAIRSFFKYLYSKTSILYENPASDLESPKINKRNPIYLTLDESKNLLNSIDNTYKHNKRDFCIITLFLNCGLRLSELCSINISKIKDDTLTIVGKGNKERTVYLNNACLKAISQYMQERAQMDILPEHKDALFISERKCRINKRTVEFIVKKYTQVSGLDKTRYTPHKLRHTAATLMYKHGNVDIRSLQRILGHENISTTQIYTHVDDERLREAIKSNPLNE